MSDIDLGRVKDNVATMVRKGAPESDIDAYISHEGTTIDAVKGYQTKTESKPVMYGRAGLPLPDSKQELIGNQNLMDAAMMIPSMGAEGALLKLGEMGEGALTRALPKLAQARAEGIVTPIASGALKTGVAGAGGGAVFGAGTGRDVGQNAAIGAAGGMVGAGAAAALPEVLKLIKPYMGNASQQEIEAAAKKVIQNLQAKDVKGGGLTADEIIKQVKEAKASGKPLAPIDVAGENLKGRAGTIARVPGTAKQQIQAFFKARDEAAAKRLSADLDKYLGTGSARKAMKKTAEQRSAAARPLFEKAYQGGSLAPLETQYQKAWQESTKTISDAAAAIKKIEPRITMLTAKLSQTNNVYQQASLRKELEAEEAKLTESLQNLATAKDDERLAFNSMKQARTDRTASTPGAVWSPKIARWMSNPEVKRGINKGIAIERNEADAAGRPFDPTEYAITGMDKDGNPIVGKVPNMRLLASAKEGLDARLLDKDIRDEKTGILTKEGVAIKKLRDALRSELVRLNPDYEKALGSWAGHSAVINATNYGKNIALKQPAEQIEAELASMSPTEREAARTGLSDELKVRLSKTAFNGDESKKILNSEYMKAQLKPFFRSESDYEQFVKNVSTERTMFETPVGMKGGSKTAEREAVDEEGSGLHDAVGHAAMGRWGKLISWLREQADTAGWKNKAINDEIAKLIFNPNIPADYLKTPVALGQPTQSVVRKSAPYVGTGLLEAVFGGQPNH